MKKGNNMGADKNHLVYNNQRIQYSLTVAETPQSYKPTRATSKLRKRTEEELKASRCSAYKYLIP